MMNKYLIGVAGLLSLILPAKGMACSADVQLVSSETDGRSIVHTFRVSQAGEGFADVSFTVTTEYLYRGRAYVVQSGVAVDLQGTVATVERAVDGESEIEEISAVKIGDIRCVP